MYRQSEYCILKPAGLKELRAAVDAKLSTSFHYGAVAKGTLRLLGVGSRKRGKLCL